MDEGQKKAADVLVRWRAVERATEDPAIGEEGVKLLQAKAERLRDEYQRLVRCQHPRGRRARGSAVRPIEASRHSRRSD